MSLTKYVTCLGKQIVVIDGLEEVIRQQKAIEKAISEIGVLNAGKKRDEVLVKENK